MLLRLEKCSLVGDISYAPAREAMAFEMEGHSAAPDVYIVSKGVLSRFTRLNAALKRAAE